MGGKTNTEKSGACMDKGSQWVLSHGPACPGGSWPIWSALVWAGKALEVVGPDGSLGPTKGCSEQSIEKYEVQCLHPGTVSPGYRLCGAWLGERQLCVQCVYPEGSQGASVSQGMWPAQK